jgi:hypothetical protein
MYGVPVRPQSGVSFAAGEVSAFDGSSRPNQPRSQLWGQVWRDNPSCAFPFIALSGCLLFALSGCSGVIHFESPENGSTAVLSALSCTGKSMTGSGTDTCTVTLNAAAPAGGLTVSLSTSSTAVTVPAAVTIPANASSAAITATVLPVANSQTVTLTASAGSVSKTFALQLNVTKDSQAAPSISWTAPDAITYGTALSATQLDANSNVPGTFAYTPAAGTVLRAGAQTLSVTFTPIDTIDYTIATATVTLNVNQATPVISWTPPAAITYGTALSATQLDANSSVPGTFAYTPAAETLLKAGARTLSVTFTPINTTDCAIATATVTLNVNQATPVISWTPPAAITSGTALNSTQLDASSAIPGAFVYSPAAGTVLAAGSQTLSVTLTPTDTTDYTTATQTVTIAVNQDTSTLSINATSVGFGNVALNTQATQSLILSSTGTASVTINSAVLTGAGFTMSGPTFPATLAKGQTATLGLEFDPTATGAATGSLTVTSTSSSNGTVVIPLTGTATAASYSAAVSWDAPTSSRDPVAGYNVYRSPIGSSMYQLLNSSLDAETNFVDSTVQSGQSYDYVVKSVDDFGVESPPTIPVAVTIP